MYPATYKSLFPSFPRDNSVFVAMSFGSRFQSRYDEVIEPAVRSVLQEGTALEPYRVDAREISDSILTDILNGISSARAVLADISTIGYVDSTPIRNANVMYEVGIAQATRLPEEVLLFRSDSDTLLFDLANVRVNSYDPDGHPDAARSTVTKAIISTLSEVDSKRRAAVKQAAEALDYVSWMVLASAQPPGSISHPLTATMGQVLGNSGKLNAINRLLDMGALRALFPRVTPELLGHDAPAEQFFTYQATPFGSAVFHYGAEEIGLLSPEIRNLLDEAPRNETHKPAT
jgi:hypothetical protein